VSTIVESTGALESWRQESEGAVDDLKLKMSKLTKVHGSICHQQPTSVDWTDLRVATNHGAGYRALTYRHHGCSTQRAPRRNDYTG
jgi:hypothetical protein